MWSRDLPENLVVEILSMSPVKSLMRFKSVRKSWHAYLRNHSFITQHHKWATSDNQGRGVVFTHEHQRQTHVALLSNDTLEMSRDIEILSFFPEKFDKLLIDGPCNGIFFLYGTSLERIFFSIRYVLGSVYMVRRYCCGTLPQENQSCFP